MHIIITILIGALAGFLAGKIMKGSGFGFWVNLIVGIVGGFIGGNVLSWVGINWGGLVGQIVTAVIGAVILLWLISLIKKK
ncbi:MAG: GlsB/YeaQ/YmgE family stress response membrane protein [Bacteroidales bacterium]|nr:GlsB/YeaQ/YmgE family stress response membrane protein [Bacteroidales bacterium]